MNGGAGRRESASRLLFWSDAPMLRISEWSAARFDHAAGYSLIELISVMVVIAIIAVVVVPRTGSDDLIVATQADQLSAAIRYAQSASVSKGGSGTSGRRYRIQFTSSSYQMLYYDVASATSTAEVDPATGSSAATLLGGGVTLTVPAALPASLVGFNAAGVPYTDAAVTATALASTASVTLSKGTSARSVQVFAETGMVRVP
jgi:MSHA pilin protein MshC